jgi:hypothetical protein
MTRSIRRPRTIGGLVCTSLALGGFMAGLAGADGAMAQSGTIPPSLLTLRPVKAISYQPSPSDDCLWQAKHCPNPNPPPPNNDATYYDSDFYNTDFPNLWGSGSASNGRNDLATISASGANLLHIYSWNPQRHHTSFLDAANAAGLKVMIPITNYTACAISGGCQGIQPAQASYQTAYNIIQGTFNEIYANNGSTPHPAAAVWAIFNEYDLNSIDPKNVVFAMQAIMQLEVQAGVTGANRLPFVVPVSNAVNNQASGTQPAYFANAEALYLALNTTKTDATIPPGVLSIVALSVAMQNAATNATVSYRAAADATPVSVAAMPADFWRTRYIATVNPFSDGPTLNRYITDAGQFQSAFPGANVTAGSYTWNAAWNTLPPLFFSESGINIAGSASPPSLGTPQTQAAFVLKQLQCTIPWAIDATSTPQGYFLGTTIFEFLNEDANGRWGMQVFASPASFALATTTGGATYRVDQLSAQPAWANVATGFKATAKTCQ